MRQNMKPRLENPEHLKALAVIVGPESAESFSHDCSRCGLTIREVLEDGLESLIREQQRRSNPLIFDPFETRPECDRGEEGLKRFLELADTIPELIVQIGRRDENCQSEHPWIGIAEKMIPSTLRR